MGVFGLGMFHHGWSGGLDKTKIVAMVTSLPQ